MPSNVQSYAQVLVELAQTSSPEEFREKARRLGTLLKARGEAHLRGRIVQEFERRWKRTEGKTATVRTARTLSESERQQLSSRLREAGYRLLVEEQDEGLLGGMELILGEEWRIDGTVRGRLRRLARSLAKK